MRARIEALQAELEKMISGVGDPILRSQIVGTLQTEQASLKNQVASNEIHITTLQSQVAASKAEIAALRRETSNLQRQLQANDAKMAAYNGDAG